MQSQNQWFRNECHFVKPFTAPTMTLLLVILRGKIWYENLLWNQLKCSALKIYNTQHCSYWEKKRLLGSILAQYVLLKFVSRLRLCSLQGLSLEMLASWKHATRYRYLPSRLTLPKCFTFPSPKQISSTETGLQQTILVTSFADSWCWKWSLRRP